MCVPIFYFQYSLLHLNHTYINLYIMMILRRITSESLESNTYLGEFYNLILRDKNPEHFEEAIERLWKGENEEIYGFVIYDHGSGFQPLWVKSYYYIMTERGATFANLTKK